MTDCYVTINGVEIDARDVTIEHIPNDEPGVPDEVHVTVTDAIAPEETAQELADALTDWGP